MLRSVKSDFGCKPGDRGERGSIGGMHGAPQGGEIKALSGEPFLKTPGDPMLLRN